MRLEAWRKIRKRWYSAQSTLSKKASCRLHHVSHARIKLITEESTKKIFKPKFELVQAQWPCFNTFASTLLRLYSRDRNHWSNRRSSNVMVCRTILRDIPTALGVRFKEELCQDKARNLLYNLSDSLTWKTFKPLWEVCLSQRESGRRRLHLSFLVP
jgi:hypothetical protein